MLTVSEIISNITYRSNEDADTSTIQRIFNQKHQFITDRVGVRMGRLTYNIDTVADQKEYRLPVDFNKAVSLNITVGDTRYTVFPIESKRQFDMLKTHSFDTTSDTPEFYYIGANTDEDVIANYSQKLFIYPTPSTSDNTIELVYLGTPRRFTSNDFSDIDLSGEVSVTQGSEDFTTSSTDISGEEGRHIKINGDGQWYRISSTSGANSGKLEIPYEGPDQSGADATIGTFTLLPSGWEYIIEAAILELIWEKREEFSATAGKSMRFRNDWVEGIKDLKQRVANNTIEESVYHVDTYSLVDPNLTPPAATGP